MDVPFPADYGGVVDLFYKLKALHQQGVKIHLHCFTKDRPPREELNQYCEEVFYYPRKNLIKGFSFSIPFMVKSRTSDELIKRLEQDNYPVLMEGIHCTWYLHKNRLANRKVLVRLHNTEFEYYRQLAGNEKNFLKKIYFLHESRLLKKYEKAIANKALLVAVSEADAAIFRNQFNAKEVHYLPVFIPWTMASGKEGNGCYCLYHGNLSINENEKAATWLLTEIFAVSKLPLVIAGKNPSKKLEKLVHQYTNTCLVANPSEKEMQDMIAKAHINILPAFNNTGIKLKLLNAVFNGRFCLVNKGGVAGSGMETVCSFAESAAEFKAAVEKLYQQHFTQDDIERRQGILQREFNNEANAKKLVTWLW